MLVGSLCEPHAKQWIPERQIDETCCIKPLDFDTEPELKTKPPTLPETNILAPKNGWLEYYFPIGKAYFQERTC